MRDGARGPGDLGFARTEAHFMWAETSNLRGTDVPRKKKKDIQMDVFFLFKESARRDSNPRPRPWQGRAPPTEPLAHVCCLFQQPRYTILYFCLHVKCFSAFFAIFLNSFSNASHKNILSRLSIPITDHETSL